MKQSRVIESLILAIGLVIMGGFISSAFDHYTDSRRVVTVKGLAEMEVKADKVTWPIVYRELGNDLPTIYNRTNKINQTIITYLNENGISTEEITVNAPEVADLKTDRYNSNPITDRYNVTGVITVTSDKVDKVREIINKQGELLKKGIALVTETYSNPITYEYTSLNKIKPEMIQQATKNARIAAEQFAKDSDCKIGEIVTANQGQFSITNRDQYTPYIKSVRVVTTITYSLQ
ncbi:MAG: SIMPL domain-containing protein [Bacteroidales bacterium]